MLQAQKEKQLNPIQKKNFRKGSPSNQSQSSKIAIQERPQSRMF